MVLRIRNWKNLPVLCVAVELVKSREWRMDEKERRNRGGHDIFIPKPLLNTWAGNPAYLPDPCSTLQLARHIHKVL